MRIVKVAWIDTAFCDESHSLTGAKQHHEPVRLESVGWLIEETEDKIQLAMECRSEDDIVRYCQSIPKRAVLEVETLKEKS